MILNVMRVVGWVAALLILLNIIALLVWMMMVEINHWRHRGKEPVDVRPVHHSEEEDGASR